MTRIIAISNQKGGVGKTTTAISLAGAFAKLNKSVLIIDMDPQGNAGRGLGLDPTAVRKTILDALTTDVDINKTIRKSENKNIDVIMANLKLATIEAKTHDQEPLYLLKNAIASLTKEYDFIIIDCPPSLGLLSLNALCAADQVLVPVQCEFYALEAVAQILSTISRVQKNYNHNLEILGFLLTMYDARLKLATDITTEVRSLFKEKTFVTEIPRNNSIAEAAYYGKPVTDFRPTATGSVAYLSLAREILNGK
jgi:chromosome partitioning protein